MKLWGKNTSKNLLHTTAGLQNGMFDNLAKDRCAQSDELSIKALFNCLNNGLLLFEYEHDCGFTVADINNVALKLLRQRKESVVGCGVDDVSALDDFFGVTESLRKVHATGVPENRACGRFTRDGTVLWVERSVCKLPCGRFIAVLDDVTARKNAEKEREVYEKQFKQLQKMQALATMAGGIAHDFNNLLAPIIGYAELIQTEVGELSPLDEYLEDLFQAALRAKDLTRQILHFSRPGSVDIQPIRIQPVVREAAKLASSGFPPNISLVCDIDEECGEVQAQSTQVHQIVMNLASNGGHAMEKTGGELTVRLKPLVITDGMRNGLELLPGKYLELAVSDTGAGIREIDKGKILTPYFTTKGEDRGTGLGLAIISDIVKGLSGGIRFRSEEGKGTEVSVYLPRAGKEGNLQQQRKNSSIPSGSEHIVLVDDDEFVLSVQKRMLEQLGYQVTAHLNSTNALNNFRIDPTAYDLVISDMVIPKMMGGELANRIKSISPYTPVIICSGYSEKSETEKCIQLNVDAFMLKPVSMQKLAVTVRAVLDGCSTS